LGSNGFAPCGGLFRNSAAYHLGSFTHNGGQGNALQAELTSVMLAIEPVSSKDWNNLWLETISKLVVMTVTSYFY